MLDCAAVCFHDRATGAAMACQIRQRQPATKLLSSAVQGAHSSTGPSQRTASPWAMPIYSPTLGTLPFSGTTTSTPPAGTPSTSSSRCGSATASTPSPAWRSWLRMRTSTWPALTTSERSAHISLCIPWQQSGSAHVSPILAFVSRWLLPPVAHFTCKASP